MNKKKYQSVFEKNPDWANLMAISLLMMNGKSNLLDAELVNSSIKEIENKKYPKNSIPLVSKELQIETIELARELASLEDIEIFRYIKYNANVPKPEKDKNQGHDAR